MEGNTQADAMYQHHKDAVQKLKRRFIRDPAFLAVIVGGSVARGRCREDSDVDAFFVVAEEEYSERVNNNAIYFQPSDICDYPGGYVDGKIIDYAFLEDVQQRGSEVARSAFIDAMVLFSHIPDLELTLRSITEYPTIDKTRKLESFVAQFEASKWYIGEAVRRDDQYLLMRYTTNLILFGIRMILAHNERLYSYHKYLLDELRDVPLKPEHIVEYVDTLLREPSKETADAFYATIMGFREWPLPSEGWCGRFIRDTEHNWRVLQIPIEDR